MDFKKLLSKFNDSGEGSTCLIVTDKTNSTNRLGVVLNVYSDEGDGRFGYAQALQININKPLASDMMSLTIAHEFAHWVGMLKETELDDEEEEQVAHMVSYLLNNKDERIKIFIVDTPKILEEANNRLDILNGLNFIIA